MNAESSTPPNPSSNSHPALQLVSRIDILDTKLRLLELYVSEAQTAAAAESKRVREQFHAELSALQAEVKQKETNLETHQALARQADRNQRKQIQELRAELLEANRLAESRQTEVTANKLASTALRERIKFLEIEGENRHVENTRQMASLLEHIKQLESANERIKNDAGETEAMRAKFELELAALRQEFADKSTALESAEAREFANTARHANEIQALENDGSATKRLLEENHQALEEARSENRRLHDRIAALTSVHEQVVADAQRVAEARAEEFRQQMTALEQNAAANAELLAQRSQEAAQGQRLQAALQQKTENHAKEAEDARLKLAEVQRVQQALENQLAEAAEGHRRAEQLEQELRSVSTQLAEKQRYIDQRNHEFEILQSDLGQLRAQVDQLEEAKWLAGEQYGASLGKLNAQLQELGVQLAEKEQQIATREREFAALQEHAQQLGEQLAQQEHLRQQAADEHSIAIGALQLELRQSSDQITVARQTVEARDAELSELREGARHLIEQTAALEHERNQAAAAHSAQTQHLESQLREVANQLGERQQDLEARERELGTLHNVAHELQRQIAELTQARERDADEHQCAIAALHQQKSQLESQLKEKQQLIESRENEVAELQENARGLHEQLQRLEQTPQKVVDEQSARVHDLEQEFSARSGKLEAALAQRSELLAQRVAELEAQRGQIGQLDERITQLQHDLEVSYSEKQAVEERRETLQRQLEEKQQLIESRENEVAELQENARGLHEQLQRLEQTHQKVVEEQGARVHDLEQKFSARSGELEAALAQRSELLAQRVAELEAQRGRIGQLDERITQLQHDLKVSYSEKQDVEERRQTLERRLDGLQRVFEETQGVLQVRQAELSALHEQAETERHGYTQRATEWDQRFHAQKSELQRGREELAGLQQHLKTLEKTHHERLQKSAQELAQTRERYDTEIAALSDEVLRKEAALHNRSAELAASEARLNGEIQGWNAELAHEQQRRQGLNRELAQRSAEIDALRAQVTELEILSTETDHTLAAKLAHLSDTHAKELADLQAQLREQEQSLAAKESLWLTREARAQAELAALQQSNADKHRLIEQRELAIANLQHQANELATQCHEAEAGYKALSENFNETEQRFTTEIALRQVAILQLQNELADTQRYAADLEQSSSLQVNDLQRRLEDNEDLLGQRTARLDELNREIDSLHHRLGVLQQTNDQLFNDGTQQKEQFRLRLAELENAVADGAALLEQHLTGLERSQAEVSALRQHILTVESLHQHAQTGHQSARAVLQDDLGRARQALEQRELDFAVETRSLQAARDQLAEELGTLQARLADREGLLAERESDCAALRAEIQALRVQQADSETAAQQAAEAAARSAAEQAQRQAAAQIAEKEALLSESLAVQEAQRIELAALREQSAQFEQLRRRTERAEADYQRAEQVSAELAALRARLEEKESALAAHEERVRALESSHRESLGNLQVQLAQHQLLAESRARQTEDLRSHIGVLQGQLVALEDNGRAFAERQQAEFARTETSLRADLDELHKQIAEYRTTIEARSAEIGALQNEKVALQGEIERLAAAGLQLSSVNAAGNPATYDDQLLDIANLRAEIVEKQRLLEDRNDKLIQAKGELADLQKSMERIVTPQDGSRPPAVAATNNDLLWEQLSQNDRAAERPEAAVVNDRETGFRVTFDRRHNDNLAMPRSAPSSTAEPSHGVSRNAAPATGDDAQGLEFLLRDGEGDGRPLPNNGHDRRWRFSLGKKRRWKS